MARSPITHGWATPTWPARDHTVARARAPPGASPPGRQGHSPGRLIHAMAHMHQVVNFGAGTDAVSAQPLGDRWWSRKPLPPPPSSTTRPVLRASSPSRRRWVRNQASGHRITAVRTGMTQPAPKAGLHGWSTAIGMDLRSLQPGSHVVVEHYAGMEGATAAYRAAGTESRARAPRATLAARAGAGALDPPRRWALNPAGFGGLGWRAAKGLAKAQARILSCHPGQPPLAWPPALQVGGRGQQQGGARRLAE